MTTRKTATGKIQVKTWESLPFDKSAGPSLNELRVTEDFVGDIAGEGAASMQLQSADGGGVGGLRRVPEGALERLAATHRVVDARAEQRVFVAFLSEAALRTAADPWRVVRVVSGLWVVYALFIVRGVVRGVVRGRAPRRR